MIKHKCAFVGFFYVSLNIPIKHGYGALYKLSAFFISKPQNHKVQDPSHWVSQFYAGRTPYGVPNFRLLLYEFFGGIKLLYQHNSMLNYQQSFINLEKKNILWYTNYKTADSMNLWLYIWQVWRSGSLFHK